MYDKLIKRFKLPTETKMVKLNLVDEYKSHLFTVSKMPHFSSMKMYMDHSFYKVFMPDEILQNQTAAFEKAFTNEEELHHASLTSTLLKDVPSFLEP